MNQGQALDVLNLADAGFPTGAHGHSAGLEYAIQAGWVADRPTWESWAERAIRLSFIPLDLRASLKVWYGDPWVEVDAELASFRSSRVQREASAQVGRSFLRSVSQCYGNRVAALPLSWEPGQIQFPIAWALAFRELGLSAEALAETLVFGCLRQWTQVAIRILPLGQKDAFAGLTALLERLPPLVTSQDEARRPLESLAPGLELAGLGMGNLERKYFRS